MVLCTDILSSTTNFGRLKMVGSRRQKVVWKNLCCVCFPMSSVQQQMQRLEVQVGLLKLRAQVEVVQMPVLLCRNDFSVINTVSIGRGEDTLIRNSRIWTQKRKAGGAIISHPKIS